MSTDSASWQPVRLARRDERAEPDTTPGGLNVGLVSLGCPKNLVDSEVMLGQLVGRGHKLVTDSREADVLVVNTCSVSEHRTGGVIPPGRVMGQSTATLVEHVGGMGADGEQAKWFGHDLIVP